MSTTATDRVAGAAVTAVAAGLLLVTTLSQHPSRTFDRFREFDRLGVLIPNWRFFAPEPARHDFHVLYRVRTADGATSPWAETTEIAPRRLAHAVWFPGRRREKAMFDVANELVMGMVAYGGRIVERPAYRLLVANAARLIRDTHTPLPQGFQILLAKAAGHDEAEEPEYLFVSPYIRLDAAGRPLPTTAAPELDHLPVASEAVPAP